jgi:cytochrome c-type protein NapB
MSTPYSEQALHVGFAVIIGIALIGFFVGVQRPPEAMDLGEVEASESDEAPPAITYAEKRHIPPRLGSDWPTELARFAGPGVLDPVSLDGTSKAEDLASRAALRAYDGAPPTIPHDIRQQSVSECLACHDSGMQIRGRLAPPMSHEAYTSCTQCHVVNEGPSPGAALPPDAAFGENAFVGLVSPTAGARAWSIAPPVIPHKTTMRERCMSCHGPNGRDALRSTHPDRSNCVQCHASSAELDLRPGVTP